MPTGSEKDRRRKAKAAEAKSAKSRARQAASRAKAKLGKSKAWQAASRAAAKTKKASSEAERKRAHRRRSAQPKGKGSSAGAVGTAAKRVSMAVPAGGQSTAATEADQEVADVDLPGTAASPPAANATTGNGTGGRVPLRVLALYLGVDLKTSLSWKCACVRVKSPNKDPVSVFCLLSSVSPTSL